MKVPSQRTAGAIGGASAVVLILSMFLDWYKADLPSQIGRRTISVPTYNAFEGLERSDIYLVVAAALGVLFAGMLLARMRADSPAPALLLLTAGLFALALVIYRATNTPGELVFGVPIDTTLRFGWVIALLAAGSMALAGLLAYLGGPRLVVEASHDEPEVKPDSAGEAERGGRDSRGEADSRAEG